MVPAPCARTVPVPPPAYHRAQAKVGPALHVDALTLVSALHVLALCRLAVRLARRHYSRSAGRSLCSVSTAEPPLPRA